MLLALASAASLGGRWWWICDVLSSFVNHYAVASLLVAVALAALRRPVWASLALAVAIANGWRIAPYLPVADARAERGPGAFEIVQWNVGSTHPDPVTLERWLDQRPAPPEVLALFEVTPAWRQTLDRVATGFAYHARELRSDNFGIAVFSRLPRSRLSIVYPGALGLPSVLIQAEAPGRGGPVRLIASHPGPPIGAALWQTRNAQLEALARLTRATPGPVVLLGDLNITPWSPAFARLLDTSGLVDAQAGRGLRPTWAPRRLPLAAGLVLDHTLIGTRIAVLERRVLPRLGSDHSLVATRLALRARP